MAFPHTGNLFDDIKDRFNHAVNQHQQRNDAYDEPYDDYYDGDDFVPGEDYGPYAYDEARDASYVEQEAPRSAARSSDIRYPRLVTMEEAAASASSLGVTAEEQARASHFEGSAARPTERIEPIYSSEFATPTDHIAASKASAAPAAVAASGAEAFEPVASSHRDVNAGVTEVLESVGSKTREPHGSAGLNGLFEPTTSAVRSVSSRRGTHVVRPLAYRDASGVAAIVKNGDVAVLDLRSTDSELSSRLLDFSFGVASALDARVEVPFEGVFALCKGAALTADEKSKLQQQGIR